MLLVTGSADALVRTSMRSTLVSFQTRTFRAARSAADEGVRAPSRSGPLTLKKKGSRWSMKTKNEK
jgi:hypothetical protein